MSLPLFPVTTVGSWPRSEELLKLQRAKQAGRLSAEDFEKAADEEVREFVCLQEEIGVDIITDGEQRRDNFYSFVTEKLEGTRLMSLSEMLDLVEDRASFEQLLDTLDVPAFAIKNPTCTGPISVRERLAVGEARFLKSISDRPVKIPLPGPYLLTRAMWVPEAAGLHYGSKEELGQVVVQILGDELEALAAEGVDFVQFDEPVLTELVFSQGKTRTFMCAALASRNDPAEELDFARSLINQVAERAPKGLRIGVHVCRGNWSRREETLLVGNYRPLQAFFESLNVTQLVLEYHTPRAGDLMSFGDKELGLGAINPRTEEIETVDSVVERAEQALEFIPADKLFLNPDCGFGTFSMRPINVREAAAEKLRVLVGAAERLRSAHQPS